MRTAILRANALSCILFGLLFALLPDGVASFVGDSPTPVVLGIGIVLILNGLHLAWASFRPTPPWELRHFAIGDFLWVLITVILIAGQTWITRPEGIAAAIAVGLMVGTFGIMQWRLAKEG